MKPRPNDRNMPTKCQILAGDSKQFRSIPVGEGKQKLRWEKSKVGVFDHFEPSVSFETWHKAISSNIRSKPYANFLVEHSSEEKFSVEVHSHIKNSLKWTKFK